MVIDSTDKDRIHISRTELHTMMEDEVIIQLKSVIPKFQAQFFFFFIFIYLFNQIIEPQKCCTISFCK
jgi:hypothetical protein